MSYLIYHTKHLTHNNAALKLTFYYEPSLLSLLFFLITLSSWHHLHPSLSFLAVYMAHVLHSNSPEVKSTMDLRQEYSAVSTCSAFSFSTCSWKTRMWSMKATTLSADMGDACRPAAANRGATWSGMEHWAALRTKSSLHDMRSSATWNADSTELVIKRRKWSSLSRISVLQVKHNVTNRDDV